MRLRSGLRRHILRATEASSPVGIMAKHSKRILVADDEESIRRLLEYNLRKFGFEPVLVKNGSEAILAASDDLTCVLVDLKMPEVGGLAVLEHLKKAHPDVPVIIMSAVGQLKDADEPEWPHQKEQLASCQGLVSDLQSTGSFCPRMRWKKSNLSSR